MNFIKRGSANLNSCPCLNFLRGKSKTFRKSRNFFSSKQSNKVTKQFLQRNTGVSMQMTSIYEIILIWDESERAPFSQRGVLSTTRLFSEMLWSSPLKRSRNEAPGSLSYTALLQDLNSFCEQETQALSIIKTAYPEKPN